MIAPPIRAAPAPADWENEGGHPEDAAPPAARLDWAAFKARFHPSAPRHDYASLAAYEAYRNGRRPPSA